MRRLGFEKLIDGKASRERDLAAAMMVARIIAPEASKLAMTHAWSDTTLAEDFSVADAMKTSFMRRWTGWVERKVGRAPRQEACLKDGSAPRSYLIELRGRGFLPAGEDRLATANPARCK